MFSTRTHLSHIQFPRELLPRLCLPERTSLTVSSATVPSLNMLSSSASSLAPSFRPLPGCSFSSLLLPSPAPSSVYPAAAFALLFYQLLPSAQSHLSSLLPSTERSLPPFPPECAFPCSILTCSCLCSCTGRAFLDRTFLDRACLDRAFLDCTFLNCSFFDRTFLNYTFLNCVFLDCTFLNCTFLERAFLECSFVKCSFLSRCSLVALSLTVRFLDVPSSRTPSLFYIAPRPIIVSLGRSCLPFPSPSASSPDAAPLRSFPLLSQCLPTIMTTLGCSFPLFSP